MAAPSDSPPTEAIAAPTFERALRDGFRIVVIDGPDRGATAESTGGTMTLGNDPACDVTLTCRAVSGFHCEIELDERGAIIRDLGSTICTRTTRRFRDRSANTEAALAASVDEPGDE